MAINTVQVAQNTTGSSYTGTLTVTFSGDTHSGNFLVLAIGSTVDTGVTSPGGNIVSTVTDNMSNTWTLGRRIMGNNNCAQEIWYTPNITGGSGHIVTITMSQSVWGSVIAKEYSGIATASPRDVYSESASATSDTTFLTGDTVPPTNAYELVIAACSVEAVASISEQSSTGYGTVTLQSASPQLITLAYCDKVISTSVAQDASFLSTVGAYGVSQVITFKDNGDGPPTWSPSGAMELIF